MKKKNEKTNEKHSTIDNDKELKKLQKVRISISHLLISIKSIAALLRASIPLSETIQTIS